MENSKPAWQSKTVVTNLVIALAAFCPPASALIAAHAELFALSMSGLNLALRYVSTMQVTLPWEKHSASAPPPAAPLILPAWALGLPLDKISAAACAQQLSPHVLMALVYHESAGNQFAFRYEPNFKWTLDCQKFATMTGVTVESETIFQKTSFGYCQIMAAVCRGHGFDKSLGALFDADINLRYGAVHLSGLLKKYSNLKLALAAYNAGSPRFLPDDPGTLVNQAYVDAVMALYQQLMNVTDTPFVAS